MNKIANWKPVAGYEGFYEISDLGQVKSLARVIEVVRRSAIVRQRIRERLMKLSADRDGYLQVTLSRDGAVEFRKVHHLVLSAFVGPRPDGLEAAHLDNNPANNRVANLAWIDHQSNLDQQIEHGTRVLGAKHWFAKLTEASVPKIRSLYAAGRSLESLGKEFHVHRASIWDVVNRKTWRHVA